MVSDDGLTIDAVVLGNDLIKTRFLNLGDSLRTNLRTALLNAGKMIQGAESALAPRATGKLADTIRVSLVETGTSMSVTVRPSKFYAQFMEFGVVNHGSRNNSARGGLKTKGKLKLTVRRQLVERVRELRSKGQYRIQPRHFIERAWAAQQAAANAEVARAVTDAVNEAKT